MQVARTGGWMWGSDLFWPCDMEDTTKRWESSVNVTVKATADMTVIDSNMSIQNILSHKHYTRKQSPSLTKNLSSRTVWFQRNWLITHPEPSFFCLMTIDWPHLGQERTVGETSSSDSTSKTSCNKYWFTNNASSSKTTGTTANTDIVWCKLNKSALCSQHSRNKEN